MESKNIPNSWDIREVEKAGKGLTMQAVTLSNRYISNGILKSQFVREVDRFEQCLVNDFKNGKKSKESVFKALRKERHSLIEQGKLITKKGVGFIAGVMQIAAGAGICYYSAAYLCSIGASMMAHGANNLYENGMYFIGGDENAVGIVREGYQHVADSLGYSASYGDIAYYSTDLGLSTYGIFAKTAMVKNVATANQIAPKVNLKFMPWTRTRKAKQFKLFRYSSEDYLRGYQAMSRHLLLTEVGADYYNIKSIKEKMN